MASDPSPPPRQKLGLALAGGGFRASLFHVGVLHRLAELDILRRVEVLSTVSGGSITGALYVVLLKQYLEDPARGGNLDKKAYVKLVRELEDTLVRGVQKNLRTRLIGNPLGMLLVMLTSDSLGRRMGRLYERHLFRRVVEKLGVDPPPLSRPAWLWPGQIRMEELAIRPAGETISEGLDEFNEGRLRSGGSVVTTIKINATSVNSGGRFFFSAREFGDWFLGYFRRSEFDELLARKALLALDDDALRDVAVGDRDPPSWERTAYFGSEAHTWADPAVPRRAAALAYRRRRKGGQGSEKDEWTPIFEATAPPTGSGGGSSLLDRLDDAAPGLLRPAKLSAWYLRVGLKRDPPIRGGVDRTVHWDRFWYALRDIDRDFEGLGERLSNGLREQLLDYVLEIYWLRSAERVSKNIESEWKETRVGHAVGASACFPPVFPSFLIYGVYDDLYVTRLGLTDGGVYDNSGVTGLLDEGCTQVISSDTRGLSFDARSSVTTRLGLVGRLPTLLMNALGGVQRQALRARRGVTTGLGASIEPVAELSPPDDAWAKALRKLSGFRAARGLHALAYFHIASPRVSPFEPPEKSKPAPADAASTEDSTDPAREPTDPPPLSDPPFNAIDVARLRTDLDGFGDAEVAALVNHGYDMADRYVRRYASELLKDAGAKNAPVPEPNWPRPFEGDPQAEEGRLTNILRAGTARAFRVLKLRGGPPRAKAFQAIAWMVTGAVAIGIVSLPWHDGRTIGPVWNVAAPAVGGALGLIGRAAGFLLATPPVSGGLLLLAVVAMLWAMGRIRRPASERRGDAPLLRRARTAWKWMRVIRGNLLWVVLLPLVVALAGMLVAWTSYLVYHLPFMAATRMRTARPPGRASASSRNS